MNTLSIIIADNQPLTRIGIIAILHRHLNNHVEIRETPNKDLLFDQLKSDQPQILIIDFDLFDFKEINELAGIKQVSPGMGVLIVTDNQSPDDITRVVNLGFSNYILKTCPEQEFIDAFNATLSNRKYFSSDIVDVIIDQRTKTKPAQEPGKLTLAEIEIVKLIAQGLTTKEIALRKHLSFHTVITHRKNIFRKLGINNTSELIMHAMRSGIIDSLDYYI